MTREQTFRSTFAAAFAGYTGWPEVLQTSKKNLPLSALPSFAFELGKTRFENYDIAGRALNGEQDFAITIYFMKPQNDIGGIRGGRSDAIQQTQQFINDHVYPMPLVLPGDIFRIDGVEIISIEPMRITVGESKYTAVVTGRYWFSSL